MLRVSTISRAASLEVPRTKSAVTGRVSGTVRCRCGVSRIEDASSSVQAVRYSAEGCQGVE